MLGDVSDPSGLASLTYTLNGGATNPLSLGENQVRLVAPGEFNVELDAASLQVGANTVHLKAIDIFGNQSTSDVTVTKVNGGPWALPYTADWSQAGGNPNTIAQVADGHWTVQADGTIRNSDIGYDRLVTLGQASSWTQYQGTAQVTINSMDADGAAIGIIAGFKGATSDLHGVQEPDQPRIGHPFPAAFLYDNDKGAAPKAEIYENTDAHQEQTLIKDASGLKLTLGTAYTFKWSVTDNTIGGSLYKFKIWKTGTAEPSAWLLQANGELSSGFDRVRRAPRRRQLRHRHRFARALNAHQPAATSDEDALRVADPGRGIGSVVDDEARHARRRASPPGRSRASRARHRPTCTTT